MKLLRDDGATVCERCALADNSWTRLKGLLGRRSLDDGEGLLIRPTGSIHMFFMRFPIDAIFLDRELRILKVVPDLKPWRMAARRGAKQVLEIAAGEAERRGLEPGTQLVLRKEEGESPPNARKGTKGIAIFLAAVPRVTSRNTAATKPASNPTTKAATTEAPRPAPRSMASFTSPIPMPAGWRRRGRNSRSPAPSVARTNSSQRSGKRTSWQITTTPVAGSTMRLGTMRCSMSIAVRTTSTPPNSAPTSASPPKPKRRKQSAATKHTPAAIQARLPARRSPGRDAWPRGSLRGTRAMSISEELGERRRPRQRDRRRRRQR